MRFVAMACVAGICWLVTSPSTRISRVQTPGERAAPRRGLSGGSLVEAAVPRAILCATSLMLLGWVLVGPVGGLGGAPAGVVLSVWLGRLESPTAARAREEVNRDLPLAVDLLAACASVGRAPQDSLVVVSRAVGGALATRLDEITARINLGADPVTEWGRLSVRFAARPARPHPAALQRVRRPAGRRTGQARGGPAARAAYPDPAARAKRRGQGGRTARGLLPARLHGRGRRPDGRLELPAPLLLTPHS